MKVVKIAETKKNIYISKEFVSYPRSLLATHMFAIKDRAKEIVIERTDYEGYKSVKIMGKPLNLGIDFKLVAAAIKKINESTNNVATITFKEFYSDVDFFNDQPQNNNKEFINRVDASCERIASIRVRIEDKLGRITHGALFTIGIDPVDNCIRIEANGIMKELFLIDTNAIYNIDFKTYSRLKKEYSKKLYMFYLTHNIGIENKFSIEMLKERLLCETMEDKFFNENVSDANDELVSVGFLEKAFKGYDKPNLRKVKRYHVFVNPALNKKAKTENTKKVKQEKEVKSYKEAVEAKPVEVKKTAASIQFEKDAEENKKTFKLNWN